MSGLVVDLQWVMTGFWMSGPRDVKPEETDRVLLTQFDQRRILLVNHLHLFRQKGNISGLN